MTYYFLGALAVGYCVGYFLQVCGREPEKKWRKPSAMSKLFDKIIVGVMLLLFVGVPAGLVARNWELVHDANGPTLRQFADAAASELPEKPSYVMADDGERLSLIRASLASNGKVNPDHIFIDTRFFRWTYYHEEMKAKYGDRWFEEDLGDMPEVFDSTSMIGALVALYEIGPVYYLHPSFGEFFEVFYQVPKGMIFELKKFDSSEFIAPALTKSQLEENAEFWANANPVRNSSFASANENEVSDAKVIANFYSQSLNAWGTMLQKAERNEEAGKFFDDALLANDRNISALINKRYNVNLLSGDGKPIELTDDLQSRISEYRENWTKLLRENGPIDEPSFCFYLGQVYKRTSMMRQAAQQFDRAATLAPDISEASVLLAEILLDRGFYSDAIELIDDVKTRLKDELSITKRAELDRLKARVLFKRDRLSGDFSEAVALLEKLNSEFPDSPDSLFLLAQFHTEAAQFMAAGEIADRVLERFPNNKRVLLLKSAVLISQDRAEDAVAVLNTILEIDPKESLALLNRGLSFFRLERWEEAYADYLLIKDLTPAKWSIELKLGEIAEKMERYDDAVTHFENVLDRMDEKSPDYPKVRGRLDSLKTRK